MYPTRLRTFSACALALLAGPAMADTLPLRHGAIDPPDPNVRQAWVRVVLRCIPDDEVLG